MLEENTVDPQYHTQQIIFQKQRLNEDFFARHIRDERIHQHTCTLEVLKEDL